jgi:hypothetical protein
MSKLIAQAFLSLLVSLGLIVGVNPNARGELKKAVKEAKAFVAETTEHAFGTVGESTSHVAADAAVNANVDANADASLNLFEDESTDTPDNEEAEDREDVEEDGSAESEDASPGVDGSADVNIQIGLGIGLGE